MEDQVPECLHLCSYHTSTWRAFPSPSRTDLLKRSKIFPGCCYKILVLLKPLYPENPKPADSPFHDFVKRKKGVRQDPVLAFAISTPTCFSNLFHRGSQMLACTRVIWGSHRFHRFLSLTSRILKSVCLCGGPRFGISKNFQVILML